MSKQRFKVHIEFDTNWGYLRTKDFYILENNSIDYRYIIDENCNDIPTCGSDSYCDCLAHAMLLEDYEYIGNKCIIEEISWNDLPDKIKEAYPNS